MPAPRGRRAVPARSSGPLPVILGAGAAFVAIVAVVLALSGGSRKPPPRPRAEPAAPAARDRDVKDTGLIMFVCSNAPGHEDKEVVLPAACPACSKRSSYYWDAAADGYRCFACSGAYPREKIRCPDCGRSPSKTRLKHL